MSAKVFQILALLVLMLHHSALFAVTESAHLPDEEHPYGHTVSYDHSGEALSHAGHEDDPEQHHQHGLHIHLCAFIPYSVSLNLQPALYPAPELKKFLHPGLRYSPPVPPPNH